MSYDEILHYCESLGNLGVERLRAIAESEGVLTEQNRDDKDLLCTTLSTSFVIKGDIPKSVFRFYFFTYRDLRQVLRGKNFELYFPDETFMNYDEKTDKKVMMLYEHIFDTYLVKILHNKGIRLLEVEEFKASTIQCARELLYNKIRSHYNTINTKVIKCMALASMLVAIKTVFQYDVPILHLLSGISNISKNCSKELLSKMEIDFLQSEDWLPCYLVMQRSGFLDVLPLDEDEKLPYYKVGPEELERESKRLRLN